MKPFCAGAKVTEKKKTRKKKKYTKWIFHGNGRERRLMKYQRAVADAKFLRGSVSNKGSGYAVRGSENTHSMAPNGEED